MGGRTGAPIGILGPTTGEQARWGTVHIASQSSKLSRPQLALQQPTNNHIASDYSGLPNHSGDLQHSQLSHQYVPPRHPTSLIIIDLPTRRSAQPDRRARRD
jgi:hypothetical protein